MLVNITVSGGFAGLPGMESSQPIKKLDLSQLTSGEREKYCDYFSPGTLEKLQAASGNGQAADMMNYHIAITDKDGATKTFDLRDDQMPPEMLDIIDEMGSR